jgi:hypothetical protein
MKWDGWAIHPAVTFTYSLVIGLIVAVVAVGLLAPMDEAAAECVSATLPRGCHAGAPPAAMTGQGPWWLYLGWGLVALGIAIVAVRKGDWQ